MRINKFISSTGYCSRRQADELVRLGKVMINNRVVTQLGTKIDPETDQVRIKGGPTLQQPKKTILIMLNKPKGYICTHKDEHANRTVYELLPKQYQQLFTIGRLDKDSEGLLLFTNNGELAQKLAHPKFEKEKTYLVTVRGRLDEKSFQLIEKGLRLRTGKLLPAQAKEISYDKVKGRSTLEVIIKEGKNRQIRNMFLVLHHPVKGLIRVKVGKHRLGRLKTGEWMLIKE